jgi:hypothetical protein
MRLILSMLLALTLLLAACKSSKIVADAPDEIKPSQTIPLTLSTVNVPLSIDIRQIANMLNRQFQGEVYKDDNIEDDNLKMSIIKTGDIAMQAVNNKIVFSIPMHVWAEGRAKWDPCSFCPSISKTQDVTFDVTVRTESQVNLTEDWKLKTNTTASYTWGNTKPALVIGPISIPISYAIDLALKPFMKDVNTMIDKQMAPYLDLASYVKTAWTSVQEPVLINQDMSLWLKISPQEVRLSPLTFQNNNVNMTMGLKSYVQMMSGSKPMYTVNSDLPKLIIDKGIQDNLQIGLQGTISYDKATEMAKNEVAGKVYSFENGKYNVKVNDLTINPLGDKLQVKVDLSSASILISCSCLKSFSSRLLPLRCANAIGKSKKLRLQPEVQKPAAQKRRLAGE